MEEETLSLNWREGEQGLPLPLDDSMVGYLNQAPILKVEVPRYGDSP